MTLLCLPLTATVSFVIGYLPSERRAVKEANSILDANMKELFKAIGDAGAGPIDAEDATKRPSLH